MYMTDLVWSLELWRILVLGGKREELFLGWVWAGGSGRTLTKSSLLASFVSERESCSTIGKRTAVD